MLVVLSLSVLPVGAQSDDILAPCSEEDIALATESLTESYTAFLTLGEISTDPDFDTYRALVPGYEALSYVYWDEDFAALPQCAHAYFPGYVFGRVYDEGLNIALLRWQALYESEYGDSEFAAYFAERSEARNEDLALVIENIGEATEIITTIALGEPACTEEQIEAYVSDRTEAAEIYEAVGEITLDADLEDLNALVVAYDGMAQTWDDEVDGSCAELIGDYFTVSSVFDDSLAVVSLLRVASLEAEYGDADLSAAMYDAAALRIDAVLALAESLE
jgi:hypothetical protein